MKNFKLEINDISTIILELKRRIERKIIINENNFRIIINIEIININTFYIKLKERRRIKSSI